MISFIKKNFKIGDFISIPCADGNVISGSLVEINDEDIKITDNIGETRVLKCNISTPISFITESIQKILPQTTEHISSQEVIKESSSPLVKDGSIHVSPPTQYSHLQNYIRFKAGKLPPDGRIISKREPYMVEDLNGNGKHAFSIVNVIDEDIKNSLKKNYYNGDYVNYYLDSHNKVTLLHNMKVETLLKSDLEENTRQQLENYIGHKLKQMMPGGAPIVIEIGKKNKTPITYKLSDEERCKYILSLLKRILSIGYDHLDDVFQTDLLDIQVRVTEKLLEYHSNGVDNISLETALESYLNNCVPLKNLSNSNVLGSRYSKLAEIQIQLGRPRDTIIKNARKACDYIPNNQEAQTIKERAENLPRDIWHDNRDIEINDGDSAINGIPLDRYQMDKKKVNSLLLFLKDSDQITSNRLIDSIKDYHWTVLADCSKGDDEKKASLDNYLKYSIDYKSTKTGIELLNEALKSDNNKQKEVAWYALICIGTASKEAWNLLLKNEEAGNLYEYFEEGEREQTYQIINRETGLLLGENLPPYKFLRTIFNQRREQIKRLIQMEPQLLIEEIRYFDDILECLNEMNRYQVLNNTDKNDILAKMYEIINILKSYETYDDDERIIRLNTASEDLIPIINLVRNYPTFFGCILFKLPLENWQKKIKVTHIQKKSLRQPKFSVYPDPPYMQQQDKGGYTESNFIICIKNIGQQSADGYKLDITLIPEDKNIEQVNLSTSRTVKVGAGNILTHKITIPQSMQGAKVINVSIDTEAFFGERWLSPENSRFTLYSPSDTTNCLINSSDDILFSLTKIPDDKVFKGREKDMDKLKKHYLSKKRDEIIILYGLSRMGKTTIANKLMEELGGKFVISKDDRPLKVIPFSWPIDEISLLQDNDSLWEYLVKDTFVKQLKDEEFIKKYNLSIDVNHLIKDHYSVIDFSILLDFLSKSGIYPFIVLDEFQYMKKLLVRQDKDGGASLSEAFIHSIRQKATQGLASFLFVGTYEIKDLIKNPIYGLNQGQFGTTTEMWVNKIEEHDAEELMTVMGNKLQFTREAIQYIHRLSFDIPYFIQIICLACANYAWNNKRNYIGYPELNYVICCLTGEESGMGDGIRRIEEGRFSGNMLDSSHPMEEDVLRYITLYNKERPINPRPVGLNYIKGLWGTEHKNQNEKIFNDTLNLLIEKKVIDVNNDIEYNERTYTINVDLFRRWFTFKEKRINN